MIIDFKEIPLPNAGSGEQDLFELFARDIFESRGFEILQHPGRGNDDKKDIIVKETVSGLISSHDVKYLVSCKHKAHSGRAVGNSEELDIIGRIRNNGCNGFIGFYSTIASSALQREVECLKENNRGENFKIDLLDSQRVWSLLFESPNFEEIFKRYCPKSYYRFLQQEIVSGIYRTRPRVSCCECDKDLCEYFDGVVVFESQIFGEPKKIISIRFFCHECCPSEFGRNTYTYKHDLLDYTNPKRFLFHTMEDIKFIWKYNEYMSLDVFRIWNIFTRSMFYFVSRKISMPPENEKLLRMDLEKYHL